jgi:hypothetical protein
MMYAQNVTQPFSLRVSEMLTKLLGIFSIDLDVKEGLLIRYSSAIRARDGKEYKYDRH